jgi:hypothetical protein
MNKSYRLGPVKLTPREQDNAHFTLQLCTAGLQLVRTLILYECIFLTLATHRLFFLKKFENPILKFLKKSEINSRYGKYRDPQTCKVLILNPLYSRLHRNDKI